MTPENSGYYIAAYVAAVIVYGGYVVSLMIRSRRVRSRLRRERLAGGLQRTPRSEA